jgi:phosphopantetheinyl transferase
MSRQMNAVEGGGPKADLIPLPGLPGTVKAHLLDLRRLEGMAPEIYLSGEEKRTLGGILNARRRREWLGARVCLKLMLLEEGLADDPAAVDVVKDGRQRPRAVLTGRVTAAEAFDCSLSHAGDWAMAALTRVPGLAIGADIEHVSARASALKDRFSGPQDLLLVDQGDDYYYTALWSIKEAASKAVGEGLAAGFREMACREKVRGSCRVSSPRHGSLEAFYLFYGEYAVAVATAAGRF